MFSLDDISPPSFQLLWPSSYLCWKWQRPRCLDRRTLLRRRHGGHIHKSPRHTHTHTRACSVIHLRLKHQGTPAVSWRGRPHRYGTPDGPTSFFSLKNAQIWTQAFKETNHNSGSVNNHRKEPESGSDWTWTTSSPPGGALVRMKGAKLPQSVFVPSSLPYSKRLWIMRIM